MPISLPVTLHTSNFPNGVGVNVQATLTDVSPGEVISVGFEHDDGRNEPAAEMALRPEGREWQASHVQQLRFDEPSGIDIVLLRGDEEMARRRIEMVAGEGSPHKP
jgi:hypothetical protein